MGVPGLGKKCWLDSSAPAGNPDPSRWEILEVADYMNSYALKVRYFDATNFDGVKVMVYRGKFTHPERLDPHFEPNNSSPVARFRPDDEGWAFARAFAESLSR